MTSTWVNARGWLRPVAYTAFTELICVAGTLLGPPQRPAGRAVDLGAAVLVVASGGTVGFARRWPVPSFAVALATAAGYFAAGYHTDGSWFVGLMVTAYLTGTAGQRARALVFGAAAVLAFLAAALLGLSRTRSDIGFSVLIVLGALLVGQFAAELRDTSDRREREAREEATRHALAEERIRIARELHDVVAHSIAMVNVQASTAIHVWDQQPEQALEALLNIKGASRDALRDLRAILGLLRDSKDPAEPLAPGGGSSDLAALIENVRRAGHDVTLQVDSSLQLPASVDLTIYRLIQEALTNVVRHAPGATAEVEVGCADDSVALRVTNNPPPHEPGPESRHGSGHGLAGMRERVEALRGSFEAGPTRDGGFEVRAVLPLAGLEA